MARIRIEAPAGLDRLTLAQILVGPHTLLKAEPHRHEGARTFTRYTALQTLTEQVGGAFDTLLKHAVAQVRAYVERTVLLSEVRKAEENVSPFSPVFPPLFTPVQMEAVRRILTDHVHGFIATTIDPNLFSPAEVARLVSAGVIPASLSHVFLAGKGAPEAMDWLGTAYRYGGAVGAQPAGETSMRHVSLAKFESSETKHPRPLSPQEQAALDVAKHSAGIHCRGLGNEIADDFSTIAIEADRALRKRFEGEIQDATEANIARRETWRQLASDLGHRTGDWSRSFRRIAATEKQRAFQDGFSSTLKARTGDSPERIHVAKLPAPDACPDCVRLHLTAGPGSKPRIFALAALEANGTNIGKKRPGWSAVVGPTHPWCGCELVHVPEGWDFDEEGTLAPKTLKRSEEFDNDLRKSAAKQKHLTYRESVPENGIVVRVGDPLSRVEIDKVIAKTPEALFDHKVGVTLITTDLPTVQNVFDEHDFAYWTGNEIRLMQTLPPEKISAVLMHEFGHALNVFLYQKFDEDTSKVRKWHSALDAISKREGYVSEYAKREPIENAAEVTRMYLYDRPTLMRDYPKQFAFCQKDYREILPAWQWSKTHASNPDGR